MTIRHKAYVNNDIISPVQKKLTLKLKYDIIKKIG